MSVSTCGGLIHGGGLYSGGGAYSRRFTVVNLFLGILGNINYISSKWSAVFPS